VLRPKPELPAVSGVVTVGAGDGRRDRATRASMELVGSIYAIRLAGVAGACDSSSGVRRRGGRDLRLGLRGVRERQFVVLHVEPSQPHVEGLRQPEPPGSRERDNDVLFDLPARGVIGAESRPALDNVDHESRGIRAGLRRC
jgi:hypothetical protein